MTIYYYVRVIVVVYDLATRPKFYILCSNINRISHLYEIYYKQLWIQKRMVQRSLECSIHTVLWMFVYP